MGDFGGRVQVRLSQMLKCGILSRLPIRCVSTASRLQFRIVAPDSVFCDLFGTTRFIVFCSGWHIFKLLAA